MKVKSNCEEVMVCGETKKPRAIGMSYALRLRLESPRPRGTFDKNGIKE